MSDQRTREPRRKPPPRWIPLPLEPAAPWLRLPAFTRALGLELLRVSQDEPIEGIELAQVEDWALRAVAPDPRERKAVRHAVRAIVDAGLLVTEWTSTRAHCADGTTFLTWAPVGVRLLYSMESYADHRRNVNRPSTDGGRKVDGPSTDGAPKVDAPSTNGQPTVEAKPSEPNGGTEPALSEEEREREKERDTHTTGVRVRASERLVRDDEATLEDPVSFYAAVQLRFRKLHRDAGRGDPAMGGTQVGQFPERLANTAADLGEKWDELLARTHITWVADGCPGSDKGSPYAAFVARFDRYAVPPKRDMRKGFVRSSSAESFAASGTRGADVWQEEMEP
jgi:hypothetical protein